jgi:hypothetical protein
VLVGDVAVFHIYAVTIDGDVGRVDLSLAAAVQGT